MPAWVDANREPPRILLGVAREHLPSPEVTGATEYEEYVDYKNYAVLLDAAKKQVDDVVKKSGGWDNDWSSLEELMSNR